MRFKKVKYKAFFEDILKYNPRSSITQKEIDNAYKSIKIPERRTEYSAGYDIRTPIDFTMPAGTKVVIPTGIKAVFDDDELDTWHLQMYVRSSIGIRDGVVLMNGTGIIDSDYQFGKNDGDMMLALWNTSENTVKYKAGDRICQAVFAIHGRTSDDSVTKKRTGGIGSTGVE